MNGKIVAFDRIRENLKLLRRESLLDIVNTSVSQIMVRTLITSGLSFFTALALYIFCVDVMNGFAFAMVVGFPLFDHCECQHLLGHLVRLSRQKKSPGEGSDLKVGVYHCLVHRRAVSGTESSV